MNKCNTNINVNIKNHKYYYYTLLNEFDTCDCNTDTIWTHSNSSDYDGDIFNYMRCRTQNIFDLGYTTNQHISLKQNIINKINALNKVIKSINILLKKEPLKCGSYTGHFIDGRNYLKKTLQQLNRREEASIFKSHNKEKLSYSKHKHFYIY